MKNKPKLTIELIPSTVFYSNVRSSISKNDWDKIRKKSYEEANYICEICGDSGLNQGYKHPVECHEIWDYDYKNEIQKLIGLISLCPKCHQIKHIGRTFAIGKQAEAFQHIEKVNNWNHKQVIDYLVESFIEHKRKSQIYWKLDIEILKTKFGVNKLKVLKGENKRPFWKKQKPRVRKK